MALAAGETLAPRPASPPPLSLYIHLPWCVRKCPYCDFNSHVPSPLPRGEGPGERGSIPEQDYIDALARDLEQSLPDIWGRRIASVFFGGGTPSLFSPEGIARILESVRTLTPLAPLAEITLEANPGTVEAGRFRGYRDAGVNRLSLGIQSFNDAHLAALGRIHGGREAHAAADLAVSMFERVNLDLMYVLPGQSLSEARADLAAAIASGASHISAYHLTLEPNTPFGHSPPPLPDDDTAADMQEAVERDLTGAGFTHYETSAFARPGAECRHNLNYWTFGDYLGIGAGAHSKLSFHDRVERRARVKHPLAYMSPAGTREAERRVLTRSDLRFEFFMNALRLNAGFSPELFTRHTGLAWGALQSDLMRASARGLLVHDGQGVRPTERGRRFLNELLQDLLPDAA
jgi:oxygen-independent coproporphyrinogen-3 oxidase